SGIVTSACLLIDEREFPGGLVEGEGAYAAGLRTVRFVHGIDEFPIGGQGQVGRVIGGDRAHGGEVTGSFIEAVDEEAFAIAVLEWPFGIAADKKIILLGES